MPTSKVQQGIDLIDSMSDDELNKLIDYLRADLGNRKRQRDAKARAELGVGSRVRIIGKTKPQYLQGLTATVTGFANSRVALKLDTGPIGKFWDGTLKAPAGILEVI